MADGGINLAVANDADDEDAAMQQNFVRNAPFVQPGDHTYNTPLSDADEKKFRAWVTKNKVPFDTAAPVSDYDMRGFYQALSANDPRAQSAVDPNDQRLHYPDYWKTPYHQTFSNESQWAKPDAPAWTEDDKLALPDGTVVFDDRAPRARGGAAQKFADGGAPDALDFSGLKSLDEEPKAKQASSLDFSGLKPLDYGNLKPLDESKKTDEPSLGGVAARGAERGVLPGLAGMAGAGAGAEIGAGIGAPLAPMTFGLSVPIGGFLGGLVGAYAASMGAGKAQDAGLKALPKAAQDWLGQSDEQRAADIAAHPYAADIGEMAPQLAVMGPSALAKNPEKATTAFQKLMANPWTGRALGAGLMGTQEAAQEELSGEGLDPTKLAIAAGSGAVLSHPTKLGTAIEQRGSALGSGVRRAVGLPEPHPPGVVLPPGDQPQQPPAPPAPPANTNPPPPVQPGGSHALREIERLTGEPETAEAPEEEQDLAARKNEEAIAQGEGPGAPTPPAETVPPVEPAPPGAAASPVEPATPEPQTEEELPADHPRPLSADEQRALDAEPDEGTRANPIDIQGSEDLAAAQPEAEAEKKTHARFQGIPIELQNAAGSMRSGVDADGKPWSSVVPVAYGEISRTRGADNEPVDAFVGDDTKATTAYVIDQTNPRTGAFDEHKVMLGFPSKEAALETYRAAYPGLNADAQIKGITPMPIDVFKKWLKVGDTGKPLSEQSVTLGRIIHDIVDGRVDPRAEDIAARYNVSKNAAGKILDEISQRPDTPHELGNSGKSLVQRMGELAGADAEDVAPEDLRWRRISPDVRDRRLNDYASWAFTRYGMRREDYPTDADFIDALKDRMDAEATLARAPIHARAQERGDKLTEAEAKMAEANIAAGMDMDDAIDHAAERGAIQDEALNARREDAPDEWKYALAPHPDVAPAHGPTAAGPGAPATGSERPGAGEPAPPRDQPGEHPPAEAGAEAAEPVKGKRKAPPASDWTEIGKNAKGQTIYEDQRGVRSYVENDIRHTEPVQLRPTKAGIEPSVDRGADPETWQLAQVHPTLEGKRAVEYQPQPIAEEAEHGLQGEVSPGDEGQGAGPVQGALQEKPAGSLRPGEEPGSAPVAGAADEGQGSGEPPRGGGTGLGGDAGLPRPGERPESGAAERRPDAKVEGTNFHIEPGSLEEARSPRQKAQDNLAAIELVKKILTEDRPATREEQAVLSKYVGWGGLAGAFRGSDKEFTPGFENIGKRLEELLTKGEHATARRSTQYAHYTAEPIIRSMWDAMRGMGFKGGSVFEPGMGVGHFLGMMPKDMADRSRYQGIEFDGLTAQIAKMLYPESGVREADFTKTPLPENTFDLAIGNPPFSDTVIKADPKYAPRNFVMHDYFFAKSLDSVRPGGLLGFVTSAGTMNKLGSKAREFMAQRAEFLGGVRLPSDAFKKNAGTQVTTDILFFKKRQGTLDLDQLSDADRAWTETVPRKLPGPDGEEMAGNVSRYFSEHPEQVLGQEGFFDKLYKGRYGVHSIPGRDFEQDLRGALDRLPKDVMEPERTPEQKAALDFASTEKKEGSFYLKDGVLHQYGDGAGKPVQKRGAGVDGGKTAAEIERIKAVLPIRDALRDVFLHDLSDNLEGANEARTRLNKTYDDFVAKYGPINKAEFQHRRPTVIQAEGARAEAREAARAAGNNFEEGDFDPTTMIQGGSSLQQIAASRRAARDATLAKGQPWDEGTFDPDDMPDIIIEKRPNIDPFMDDPESYRMRSIEEYNDSTGAHSKKAIFERNILSREKEPEIKSAHDGVLWSLNKHGRLDLDAVAQKLGTDRQQVIKDLGDHIYRVPGTADQYQTRDEYLSGDVLTKLDEARAAADRDPDLRRNVEALEAAKPALLAPSEIAMELGMPWMPKEAIQEFARDELKIGNQRVTHTPALGSWRVNSRDSGVYEGGAVWGTPDFPAGAILQNALNRTPPRIYKTVMIGGDKKQEFDPVATQAVADKIDAMKEAFRNWVKAPERANKYAKLYNDKMNRVVLRQYDGSYLTTPGISSDWSWRPHQTRVVSRIILSGNTYMGHAVGAGKTSAMIGAGMEMRRLGLVKKPMYVVPNHMLAQFTKEFYEQYPTAKIAVADDRRFHTSRRKQFMANVAQDDLDAVIITHSSFGKIPVSDAVTHGLVTEEISKLTAALDAAKAEGNDRFTVKKIENQIEKLEQRLAGKGKGGQDQGDTFEQMGTDFLFVDEAHGFRKLDFGTKLNLKGIDPNGSDMAWDLYSKIHYLDSKTPGRSVVLASGTPITNTMGELYSISRYLQPQALKERGVDHFDSWASNFGDVKTNVEQNASGGYEQVTRFGRFVNMPELYKMVGSAMDIVTPSELAKYVVRPALKGGKRIFQLAPRTAWLDAFQQKLAARMEAIKARKGPPQKGDDILLSVLGHGRLSAIHPRLVDPHAPDDGNSKLAQMVDNVHKIWESSKDTQFYDPKDGYKTALDRGPATQMIFSNLGIHGKEGNPFSVHNYIKSELAKRGVPANEIAFIEDYKSHVAKQKLFNDMNAGKVRILVGSVQKMGTGVNAQRRLLAIHNLDPLWFPADDEQRVGRGLRQGNWNPEIQVHDYSTKGTYDATMWQMMGTKGRFIEQFFRGDPNLRDMEDLGEASVYEQASAMATSDERMVTLTNMRQDLQKMQRRYEAHEREQYALMDTIGDKKRRGEYLGERIPQIEQDIAQRQDTAGDKFQMKVGSKTYADRGKAAEALSEAFAKIAPAMGKMGEEERIGDIGGFPLIVRKGYGRGDEPVYFFSLRTTGDHDLEVGNSAENKAAGTIQSAESQLRRFEDRLQGAKEDKGKADQIVAAAQKQVGKAFTGHEKIADLQRQVKELETALAATAAEKKAAATKGEVPKFQASDEAPPGWKKVEGEERTQLHGSASGILRPNETLAGNERAVADRVTQELARIAPGVRDVPVTGMRGEIEGRGDVPVRGAYYHDGLEHVVAWSLESRDAVGTVRHEGFHYLKSAGLISDKEYATLSKAAEDGNWIANHRIDEKYPNADHAAQIEEAIAEEFATWRRDRAGTPPGALHRIFNAIQNLLHHIAAGARRLFGKDATAADILSTIESGRVGRRGAGEAPRDSSPAYQWMDEKEARDYAAAMRRKTGYAYFVDGPRTMSDGKEYWVAATSNVPVEMVGEKPSPEAEAFRRQLPERQMAARRSESLGAMPRAAAEGAGGFGEEKEGAVRAGSRSEPRASERESSRQETPSGDGDGTQAREPMLVKAPEATPEKMAARQRAQQKEEAEARMRGPKQAKKPQANADELPLFGEKGKQGELFQASEPDEEETKGPLGAAPSKIRVALTKAASAISEFLRDPKDWAAPMAVGHGEMADRARAMSKNYASALRENQWEWGHRIDQLGKKFTPTQLQSMFDALEEESLRARLQKLKADDALEPDQRALYDKVMEAGDTIGLARLAPDERATALQMNKLRQAAATVARRLNMLSGDDIDFWTPHTLVGTEAKGGEVHFVPLRGAKPGGPTSIDRFGKNLRTTTQNLMHRKYLTIEETERAGAAKLGKNVAVVRDIRSLAIAIRDLQNAIAGKALIRGIKNAGESVGEELVHVGGEPAGSQHQWFTMQDHPAFKELAPAKYVKNPETGEEEPARYEDGTVALKKQPIYVRGEFKGPLKAVLSSNTSMSYQKLMSLKGKTMSVIMYSPLIHNAVEFGRALPAMPGKVLTGRAYIDGNRARKDPETMRRFIRGGLDPIGHRFGMNQDITSVMNGDDNLQPGRSFTAKLLGAIPGLFSREAGDSVKRAIDKFGDFYHNTLLWDRVADLQMGLAVNFEKKLLKKGWAPGDATKMAAHWANRYAGALPKEAMSEGARMLANVAFFSRTFTLGNLGTMKDMFTGVPKDVQAQIKQESGELARKAAVSMGRRKAIATVALDIALFHVANAVMQSAIAIMSGDSTLDEEGQGYARRLNELFLRAKENPFDLLNPIEDIKTLAPQGENEPGKQDRIMVGTAPDGTGIYMRNPFGKIGEELEGWVTSPLDMLRRKEGTMVRPVLQTLMNSDDFGNKIYDPYQDVPSTWMHNIGRIVGNFVGDQIPLQAIQGARNTLAGNGAQDTNVAQFAGPMLGFTFSKGYPGGPEQGLAHSVKEENALLLREQQSSIRQQIKNGDVAGAMQRMDNLKVPAESQRFMISSTLNPARHPSRSQQRTFQRQATPAQQRQMDLLRQRGQQQ